MNRTTRLAAAQVYDTDLELVRAPIRATHTGRKWADVKEVSLTRPIRRKRRKVRVRFAFEDDGFMVVELSDDDALALADVLVDYTEMERHA